MSAAMCVYRSHLIHRSHTGSVDLLKTRMQQGDGVFNQRQEPLVSSRVPPVYTILQAHIGHNWNYP